MRKAKTSLSAVAVAGALVAAGMATAPSATAAPQRRSVARTAPTWVAKTHSLGRASSSARSSFRVYLAPNGGTDALKAAVAAVSDPKSSSYRHFMTAAQYHARFDARPTTVKTVSTFLKDSHLSVTSVEAHHRYVAGTGSVSSVQKAFGTTIRRFRHRGQTVQANTTAVSLPAAIAPYVTTVTGLDTTRRLLTHNAAPPAGFNNGRPCSRTYGAVPATYQADFKTKLPKFQGKTLPYAICGYTGPLFRAAYQGANPKGLTGKGVTVAIIDAYAAPTIAKDSNRYASTNGDGSYTPGQLTQVKPPAFAHGGTGPNGCGASGWYGEETLDVEAVHAMAPDSKIRYYGAKSCYDADILDTQAKVVDQDKASIVTNSYGEPEGAENAANVAAEQQIFLQGAMQGISWMFSSGDSGDELANTGIRQADGSANDPYVTAVGGTADAIDASGTFSFQTGWGTNKYSLSADQKSWSPVGYLYGAGGGNSALFNKPAYQDGVVPNSYGPGRSVPDIAMDADPTTGMLVGETQTFTDGTRYGEYRIGGTSLASPLMAGMTALRSQNAGKRLGFLNPTIYAAAGGTTLTDIKGTPKDAGNVRADYVNGENAKDGLLYSVRTFNQDASLAIRKGWDDVTGVGSPNETWVSAK
ncbi:MAG: S53 family peptidase [Nocardioidaceae bacterium]